MRALHCNKNTYPTGIATQEPKFQKALNPADKSVRVDALYRGYGV